MASISEIENEYSLVNRSYSGLNKLVECEKHFCISGNLPIIDSNSWNWGTYQIEIWIPKLYPVTLPLLIETGGDIKRQIDWHISESGICCVGTSARQYRDMKDGISLTRWIKLFVIPYLANHAYKKDKKEYVDGELAHGIEGIYQDYAACFKISAPSKIIEILNYLLKLKMPSLNSICFCGSGKKYKRCFFKNIEGHKLGMPNELLRSDLKKLKIYYK